MTVISESPLCLKIFLNRMEVKKIFTSYEKIEFENPDIRQIIDNLLSLATAEFEFETFGRQIVEVFKAYSGGCLLKFTCEPYVSAFENKPQIKSIKIKQARHKKYLFFFSDFESVISVSKRLQNESHRFISDSLYLINNNYCLITEISLLNNKYALILNEYADFSAKGALLADHVAEYGKCIIKNDAVNTVIKNFVTRNNKKLN